jgi:hypothetical protein
MGCSRTSRRVAGEMSVWNCKSRIVGSGLSVMDCRGKSSLPSSENVSLHLNSDLRVCGLEKAANKLRSEDQSGHDNISHVLELPGAQLIVALHLSSCEA